jgi:hypothetical protein
MSVGNRSVHKKRDGSMLECECKAKNSLADAVQMDLLACLVV